VAGACVLAVATAACSSIDASGAFDSPTIDPIPADAGAYDSAVDPMRGRDAAGSDVAANILSGSPLCNVFAAGAPCVPDLPATTSAACMLPGSSIDAGIRDAALDRDAATTAPDASEFDAGLSVACRVDLAGDGTFGPACRRAGPGKDGAECMSGSDCAVGLDCVGSPGRCRPYCCNYTCSSQSFCDIQPTSGSPNLNIPVCSPVEACRLLVEGSCPAGKTCGVVDNDGTTSCMNAGPARAGQECERSRCIEGHTCLGQPGTRQCFKLCHVNAAGECGAGERCKGSVQLFSDPSIGICE